MDSKICVKCNEYKIVELYPKGRRACKSCCRIECKIYKQNNKNTISDYNKKYKNDHKDEIVIYNKNYNIDNRKTIQTRHTKYLKERRQNNPKYKMSCLLRNRIKAFLTGENRTKTKLLLGCELDFLKKWFEYQFTNDMNFKNHGSKWHIDHVIPCNKFDMLDETDKNRCFNWTNLQPLNAKINMSKKDKININEILNHQTKILNFLNSENITLTQHNMNQYDLNKYINK